MSYDLAVWERPVPTDDKEALDTYEELWARNRDTKEPPSPRILEYIGSLTRRFPDLMDLSSDEVDDSPWSDGPLTGKVMGTFFYFGLVYSQAEQVIPFIAETAHTHGLVCFDPQAQRLI